MIVNGLRFQDRFPQMKKFSQLARGAGATLVDSLEPCYYWEHGTRLVPTSNIKNSIPGGTDPNGCRKIIGILGEERRCY